MTVSGVCYQAEPLQLNGSHADSTFVAGPSGGTISGGLAVPTKAWAAVVGSPHLWRAQLPAASPLNASSLPNQLWAGGNRRPRARHPNLLTPATPPITNRTNDSVGVLGKPWLMWDKPICGTPTAGACNAAAKVGMVWRAQDWPWIYALADDPDRQLEAIVYHQWTDSRHFVTGVDLAKKTFSFSNPSFQAIGLTPNYHFGTEVIPSESGQRCEYGIHSTVLHTYMYIHSTESAAAPVRLS